MWQGMAEVDSSVKSHSSVCFLTTETIALFEKERREHFRNKRCDLPLLSGEFWIWFPDSRDMRFMKMMIFLSLCMYPIVKVFITILWNYKKCHLNFRRQQNKIDIYGMTGLPFCIKSILSFLRQTVCIDLSAIWSQNSVSHILMVSSKHSSS